MAASRSVTPTNLDPKIVGLILAGIVSEIRDEKIQILVGEKFDYKGETMLIVKFRPTQETSK
jgi:hypothetical protein